MSIFAEYKRGIISADEFRAAAAREFAGDDEPDYYEEEPEPIKEKAAAINWHPDPPPCGILTLRSMTGAPKSGYSKTPTRIY